MNISKVFIRPINTGCTLDGQMALELRFNPKARTVPIKELIFRLTQEIKELKIPFKFVLFDVRYLNVVDILRFQILLSYLASQNFQIILHTSYAVQFPWTEHFPYYCVVEDDPETPVRYKANEKVYSFRGVKDFLSTFIPDKETMTTFVCYGNNDMEDIYPYLQKIQSFVRVVSYNTANTIRDSNSLEIVL